MIAIDTNVLLRYLLRDDEAQAERARCIIECGERVLITDVVLAEMTPPCSCLTPQSRSATGKEKERGRKEEGGTKKEEK